MEYAILLFLMVFARSSIIGIPVGIFAFICCEALRFNHRTCAIVGVVVWILVSSVVSFDAIKNGFR